jgi:ABC-type nitrate/sulfonate/bicarbonate transport system substrate-binding protein
MRKLVHVLFAVVLLSAPVLAGCGGSDDSDSNGGQGTAGGPPEDPVTIRMGYAIPADDLKYVMIEKPELMKNLGKWYKLEWTQHAGVAPGVQALAAGTNDGGTISPLAMASAIEQGTDFVVTAQIITEGAPGGFKTPYLVKASSDIHSIEDLEGKVRATSGIGSTSYYVGKIALQEKGLEEDEDYELVEVPYPLMAEAINSGRADFGELVQPFYLMAQQQGMKFRTLFTFTDVLGATPVLLQGWNRDFYEENETAVAKFMEDWRRVSAYMLDPANRDEVIKIAAKVTKVPEPLLDEYFFTEDDYVRPENGKIDVEAIQRNWDFFREVGEISEDLTASDYVVTKYTD